MSFAAAESTRDRQSVTVCIAPHCSLSPRQAWWFYASAAAPCLGIAVLLATRGFWPVLPFAGAELLLLGWALHRSFTRRRQCEIITLTETQVVFERGGQENPQRLEFPRHWAQVKLRRSDSPMSPSRLTLESHGRSCEIGAFLTEAERQGLARRLGRLVGRMAETPPLAAGPDEP